MNVWLWLLVGAILFSQGLFLFIDARRRGLHAWLWGIAGLIQCPVPLMIYLLYIWRRGKKENAGHV